MCARCGARAAYQGDVVCAACMVAVRIEASYGLRRLASYLGAWASFREWERDHGKVAA